MEVTMKKIIQKDKNRAVATLTARATPSASSGGDRESRRDPCVPWLSQRIASRLEEGRTLLLDLATDLPFGTVLRGRVAPPNQEVMDLTEAVASMVQKFAPQIPALTLDPGYFRERHALLSRLDAFEKAGENFIGLIRRTRAVVAAQLERAMREAYAAAAQVAHTLPDLERALRPLAPVLSGPGKKSKKGA
jgi:hypothetical protein